MLVSRNFKRNQKMRKEKPIIRGNISLTVGLTNKETLKKIFKKYEDIFSSISFPRVPSRYV